VLGLTKSGKHKIIHAESSASDEDCLVVLATSIGFRGGNSHTGDRAEDWSPENDNFAPFPGTKLATGTIAQGDAGNMGSGSQLIACVPVRTIFRTHMSGRLYGIAGTHYHFFDGERITRFTAEERDLLDF
jgi:hypothetical protein